MKFVVLTGQIGSGKSTIARGLNALGYNVYDSDDVVRYLQKPGQKCYRRIIDNFHNVTLPNGQLDRAAIAKQVFGEENTVNLRLLNGIIHPAVFRETWLTILRCSVGLRCDIGIPHRCSYVDEPKGVILVVPLHFESGVFRFLPAIDIEITDEETQLARLCKRGADEQDSRRRIGAEMPREERAKHAALIIYNNEEDGIESCVEQADAFIENYRGGIRYQLACHSGQACIAVVLLLIVLFIVQL